MQPDLRKALRWLGGAVLLGALGGWWADVYHPATAWVLSIAAINAVAGGAAGAYLARWWESRRHTEP